jgi:phosphomannomutase
MKQLVAYDLDGTLAESKQPIDPETSALLARLTELVVAAVISGGDRPQFEHQLLGDLPGGTDWGRLCLFHASGTKLYGYKVRWEEVYAELFTVEERVRILDALISSVEYPGLNAARSWGDRIEDRGSQRTFSALGRPAPLDAKKAWNPDFTKRERLQAALIHLVADVAVRVGRSTLVDATRKGVDKAYGMAKLATAADIPATEMIFIGDALYPGGNVHAVHEAGIATDRVRDVAETRLLTEAITLFLAWHTGHQPREMTMLKLMNDLGPRVLSIEFAGKITHGDYRDTLIPAAEAMMRDGPIRVICVVRSDASDFALEAMLDDSKFALTHWHGITHLAVVSDHVWIRVTMSLFAPFYPARIKLFNLDAMVVAKEWLTRAD